MGKSWIGSSGVGAGPGYMSMGMGMGMAGRKPPALFPSGPPPDPDGFDGLGLGFPDYYWKAEDQPANMNKFVTRIGLPWSKNEQDGGLVVKNPTGWDGVKPTIGCTGYGPNVRVGLKCDAFAPGPLPAYPSNDEWRRVFALAFRLPSIPTSPTRYLWPFCFSAGNIDKRGGMCFASNNQSQFVQVFVWKPPPINERLLVSTYVTNPPAWAGKRCILVGQLHNTGGNPAQDLTVRFWLRVEGLVGPSSGNYTGGLNGLPWSLSSPLDPSDWSRFSHGFQPLDVATNADSSGIEFGGSVGWLYKGDLLDGPQVNSIINCWLAQYPL